MCTVGLRWAVRYSAFLSSGRWIGSPHLACLLCWPTCKLDDGLGLLGRQNSGLCAYVALISKAIRSAQAKVAIRAQPVFLSGLKIGSYPAHVFVRSERIGIFSGAQKIVERTLECLPSGVRTLTKI